MKVEFTPIEGLIIFHPSVFQDDRGLFVETFNQKRYEEYLPKNAVFIQDNLSISKKGVLRGLHFQNNPFSQGKLVRVVQGKAWDVAVDIRKNSSTYGQNFGLFLDAASQTQFYIPPGFAHGFVSLEENTIFEYKCTNLYNKECEGSLLWNDPLLNVKWPVESPILSEKDLEGEIFANFESLF